MAEANRSVYHKRDLYSGMAAIATLVCLAARKAVKRELQRQGLKPAHIPPEKSMRSPTIISPPTAS